MTNIPPAESAPEVEREAGGESSTDAESHAGGLLAFLRAQLGLEGPVSLRRQLLAVLRERGEAAKAFTEQEREMLLRVLRFGTLRIEDVMVPRADIVAIDERAPLAELLALFRAAGHSRIPVFRGTLDDPVGMAHIKDVLAWLTSEAAGAGDRPTGSANGDGSGNAERNGNGDENGGRAAPLELNLGCVDLSRPIASASVVREVLFVPPSMSAVDLFLRMQSTRIHLALVIDEYGGTDGLVSIEDLVEEVVGDIEDEHDEAMDAHIRLDPALGLVASARTPVSELETHLGLQLLDPEADEDIDTLGGLVFSLVNRVPVRGEIIPHPAGVEFEILDADPRRIKLLKIIRPKAAHDREASAARSDDERRAPATQGARENATADDTAPPPAAGGPAG